MKAKLFLLLLACIALMACEKKDNNSSAPKQVMPIVCDWGASVDDVAASLRSMGQTVIIIADREIVAETATCTTTYDITEKGLEYVSQEIQGDFPTVISDLNKLYRLTQLEKEGNKTFFIDTLSQLDPLRIAVTYPVLIPIKQPSENEPDVIVVTYVLDMDSKIGVITTAPCPKVENAPDNGKGIGVKIIGQANTFWFLEDYLTSDRFPVTIRNQQWQEGDTIDFRGTSKTHIDNEGNPYTTTSIRLICSAEKD